MNFLEVVKKAKHLFSLVKWSQEQLANNMLIEYDGEQIEHSSVIYLVSPDGEKSPPKRTILLYYVCGAFRTGLLLLLI